MTRENAEERVPGWADLLNEVVVLDLADPFVYIGQLRERQGEFFVLEGVDAHDLRDTLTTREKYILECRQHGVRPNRTWAWVAVREVVSISRLADVLED
jgi:hypothetical protein